MELLLIVILASMIFVFLNWNIVSAKMRDARRTIIGHLTLVNTATAFGLALAWYIRKLLFSRTRHFLSRPGRLFLSNEMCTEFKIFYLVFFPRFIQPHHCIPMNCRFGTREELRLQGFRVHERCTPKYLNGF